MGYDMSFVNGPVDGEEEAESIARAAFFAACNVRDEKYPKGRGVSRDEQMASAEQKAVEAAYDELQRARTSDFRLNIWGMSYARDLMGSYGMLSYGGDPSYPGLEVDDPDDFYEQYYENREGLTGEYKAAAELLDAWKSFEDPSGPGIPIGKLGSNDGWIVTPKEINEALEAYDSADKDDLPDDLPQWWDRWIDYLRNAADNGGFAVH